MTPQGASKGLQLIGNAFTGGSGKHTLQAKQRFVTNLRNNTNISSDSR